MNTAQIYRKVVTELQQDNISIPRAVLYPLVKEYVDLSKPRKIRLNIEVSLVWEVYDECEIDNHLLNNKIEHAIYKDIRNYNREIKLFLKECEKATEKYIAPHFVAPGCEPNLDTIIIMCDEQSEKHND